MPMLKRRSQNTKFRVRRLLFEAPVKLKWQQSRHKTYLSRHCNQSNKASNNDHQKCQISIQFDHRNQNKLPKINHSRYINNNTRMSSSSHKITCAGLQNYAIGILMTMFLLMSLLMTAVECDKNNDNKLILDQYRSQPESESARVDVNSRAREEYLNDLAKTVEQQHLKASFSMKKLDSDLMHQESNFYKKPHEGRLVPTKLDTTPTSKGVPRSKADKDMQQIMMMHEHVIATTKGGAVKGTSQSADEPSRKRNRWFIGGRSQNLDPSRVAGQILEATPTQSSKASLLSLLYRHNSSSNAIASHILPLNSVLSFRNNSMAGNRAPTTGSSGANGKTSRQHNPNNIFSPRANGIAMAIQEQLTGQLAGLGQLMFTSDVNGSDGQKDDHSSNLIDTSATVKLREPENTNLAHHSSNRYPSGLLRILTSKGQPSPSAGSQQISISTKTTAPTAKNDLLNAESSSLSHHEISAKSSANSVSNSTSAMSSRLKLGAVHLAQSYFQDSLRDLLTLSQLPILSNGPVSTAPSDLEPGGKKWLAQRAAAEQAKGNRTQPLDDFLRHAYILGLGFLRKRDPLKALNPRPASVFLPTTTNGLISASRPSRSFFNQRRAHQGEGVQSGDKPTKALGALANLGSLLMKNRSARPRGVTWDMATDPTLAVTVFHLLERASVALPLGFLLMPFVQMIRTNPLHHVPIDLARILPARAAHRSVDYEELAKRLDMMDKILSRALRQTHREGALLG